MDEHGSHNDGWYSHDGEGKNMCTGPGCDCDEKKYGYHSSPSKGNVSTFGAILSVIAGFIGAVAILMLLGFDDPPAIVIVIAWIVVSSILSVIAGELGL